MKCVLGIAVLFTLACATAMIPVRNDEARPTSDERENRTLPKTALPDDPKQREAVLQRLQQQQAARQKEAGEEAFRRANAAIPSTPLVDRDKQGGVIFYVESDRRHIAAIAPDGKLLWHKEPKWDRFGDKQPKIGSISFDPRSHHLAVGFAGVAVFALLDAKTGKSEMWIQD